MNKFKLILLLILISSLSCNKSESEKFSPEIVKIISKEDPKFPSVFASVSFFGKTDKNEIVILYVQELRKIYENKYKNLDFEDFIIKVFDENISINCEDENYCFRIDNHVERIYKTKSFKDFVKCFCDHPDSNTIILKKNIPRNQYNSISYFFFKNNYLCYFDDKVGRSYFVNAADVIKSLEHR